MQSKANLTLVNSSQKTFKLPEVPPIDYDGEAHRIVKQFVDVYVIRDEDTRLEAYRDVHKKALDYILLSKKTTSPINKLELIEISQIIGNISEQNNIITAGLIKKLNNLDKSLMSMSLYDLIRIYSAHQATFTNLMEV